MRRFVRELRRAPARIVTTVVALALVDTLRFVLRKHGGAFDQRMIDRTLEAAYARVGRVGRDPERLDEGVDIAVEHGAGLL